MANWAKWLLVLTAFTSWVSLLAVVYVARTFGATSDTLDEVRNANQIMRDEQRPWIKARIETGAKISRVGEISFRYRVSAENVGKTPASNVTIDTRVASITNPPEMHDAQVINEEIWGKTEGAREFKRNRSGLTILPQDSVMRWHEDRPNTVHLNGTKGEVIVVALRIEYFGTLRPAKFLCEAGSVMFELINPSDRFTTYEIYNVHKFEGGDLILHNVSNLRHMH